MDKPIIATIGDLHFGNKGHSIEMFEQQMRFIELQFFPFLLEHQIKFVIQLGDTFHDRNKIDWYIQNELKKRFYQWFDDNGVELHSLVGNHDCYYKSTLKQNSLSETTKHFKNVHAYTKPTVKTFGKYTLGFNPWIIDNKNPKLTEKVDILLGHFDIVGFPMMKGIYSKEGLSHLQFANYKLVLSGHYHGRTIKDNVHMVGTPFQLNWNDYNEPKGFMVLDDNFNYEYIQNTINPQYVKLYYSNGILEQEGLNMPKDISAAQSLEIVKDNYCRLFTRAVDDQMKLELYHSSLLAVSCDDYKIDIVSLQDVVEDFDSEAFDESFEEGESTIQLIMSCIEGMTFDAEIDKDLLIELAKTEYKDAHQEALSIGSN
jgi:DNA repair exonuclease SbcCD nuclease subunit